MRWAPAPFALNGICAYFTMFPLAFPYRILRALAEPGDAVLDPFCGRGTTNYAARSLGLPSFGTDTSPVAVALAKAKLATATPAAIIAEAERLLSERSAPTVVPEGEFWDWAYHPHVLRIVCRLREGLLMGGQSDTEKALRALILGALHGPQPKSRSPSYLSNQCQRTYAPKPGYAVRFWRSRNLRPPEVDVLSVIQQRAERYYGAERTVGRGTILQADSRAAGSIRQAVGDARIHWVIASPPYYGMKTYLPDQWLRHWLLGGPAQVDYSTQSQLDHRSPRAYVVQLRAAWRNAGAVCAPHARLVVRFGGIHDRKAKPLALAYASFQETGWRITAVQPAGTALRGKRQATYFAHSRARPIEEYDLWAEWAP